MSGPDARCPATLQSRYIGITTSSAGDGRGDGAGRRARRRERRRRGDRLDRRRDGRRTATSASPSRTNRMGYALGAHVFRRVQAPASRHRPRGDRRVARIARPGGRAGRRDPGAVPRLQAAQAGPPAPDRPAAAHPDALHQHHQPGAGTHLPRRRGDGAAHPAHHPLERGRDGPAGELAVLAGSAGTCRPTPAARACTRPGSTTSSAARTPREAGTRSSTRATRHPGSTRARSSRVA